MKKLLTVLFAALVITVEGSSQTRFPVTISIGDSSRLGYKRPDIAFNAGVEYFRNNCWFNIVGYFNPTDKIAYGNTTQSAVSGELFWRNDRGFFVGGGAFLRNLTFHDFEGSYWTYGPIVSGGWMIDNLRIMVRSHLLRHDIRYNLNGISWSMIYDVKKKIRFGFEQGYYKLSGKSSGQKFDDPFTSSVVLGFVF